VAYYSRRPIAMTDHVPETIGSRLAGVLLNILTSRGGFALPAEGAPMTRPVDTSKDGNIVVARSEDHEIIASRSGSTVRCAASDCKWRGPTYRIWFEISKRRPSVSAERTPHDARSAEQDARPTVGCPSARSANNQNAVSTGRASLLQQQNTRGTQQNWALADLDFPGSSLARRKSLRPHATIRNSMSASSLSAKDVAHKFSRAPTPRRGRHRTSAPPNTLALSSMEKCRNKIR